MTSNLTTKQKRFLRAYGNFGYPPPGPKTFAMIQTLRSAGLIRTTNSGAVATTALGEETLRKGT